jgi:TonB family protein
MTGASRPKKTMSVRRRVATAAIAFLWLGSVVAQEDTGVEVTPALEDERVPLNTVVPLYPKKARQARVEGEVEVCFLVNREGRTSRVSVRRSTNRVFEKPSRDAVRASTYRPLPKDQELSGIKTCRTFRFHLMPVAIEKPQG